MHFRGKEGVLWVYSNIRGIYISPQDYQVGVGNLGLVASMSFR